MLISVQSFVKNAFGQKSSSYTQNTEKCFRSLLQSTDAKAELQVWGEIWGREPSGSVPNSFIYILNCQVHESKGGKMA